MAFRCFVSVASMGVPYTLRNARGLHVQDLRRTLPPHMWLPRTELEPEAAEESSDTYRHGAYPQRLRDWSLGSQPTWGWLQHLHCTDMRSTPPPENIDCASLLACLASSPVGRPPDSADSHVGCRITMSVTQRRYSAASFVRSFLIYLFYSTRGSGILNQYL